MNIYLFAALFLTGAAGTIYEFRHKKTNYCIAGIFCILFVATAVSRVYRVNELRAYSDMAYYLKCYSEGNSSYFALGYRVLSKALYMLHCNEYVLIGVIASLNILCIWLAYDRLVRYRRKHAKETGAFLCAVLFTYSMYWGFLFATEGIRQGMAITICILSIAFMLNEEVAASLIAFVIACLFHKSILLAVAILILIRFRKKKLARKNYLIWMISLIIIDFIFAVIRVNVGDPVTSLMSVIVQGISSLYAPASRILAYFANQQTQNTLFGYMTTQYIFYNMVAIWLVSGDIEDELLNRSVLIYFIGLTIGTFFRGFIAVIRLQWVFMGITTIAIYAYLSVKAVSWWNNKYIKYTSVILYCGWQSVMILRYFGMYFI